MRISLDVLRRYCPTLPADNRVARHLLDDLGLEVKRVEATRPQDRAHLVVGEVPTDDLLVLELLANRGDHRCYVGLAREVCARNGGAVRLPELPALPGEGEGPQVRVETPLCPRYAATRLEILDGGARLPQAALDVLAAAGLASISAVVDATNLVNLELGQPTHAFDADKLVGPITVRVSRAGERAWPLFTAGHVGVPEGTVVIADDAKILAIAGVIGCEDSKVDSATRSVVLESACFDPVSVHKAARRMGIHTDASARFERGSDEDMVLVASAWVAELLAAAGAARVGATTVAGGGLPPIPPIGLSLAFARTYLGFDLPAHEAVTRLGALGFGVSTEDDTLHIEVPAHRRWDVQTRWDILEELARAIGYTQVPGLLPPVSMGVLPRRPERVRAQISELLLGCGFYEVITFGFYGRTARDRLGLPEDHPLWPHVEITNSLDRGYSLMKNNGLVHALEGLAENQAFQVDQVRTFECTRTFHLTAEGGCAERAILWALCSGPERAPDWAHKPPAADVWTLKGLVEELAVHLGLPLRVVPTDSVHALTDLLHPGRRASIHLGDRVVGVLGEVHPGVCRSFEIKRGRPGYLEIDLAALDADPIRAEVPHPAARPPSVRMLAFTLPHGFPAIRVAETLQRHGPGWLDRVTIVDVYAHEVDGAPVRTVTYALSYRNDEAALSVEVMNTTTEALIRAVQDELGGDGVRLRT